MIIMKTKDENYYYLKCECEYTNIIDRKELKEKHICWHCQRDLELRK